MIVKDDGRGWAGDASFCGAFVTAQCHSAPAICGARATRTLRVGLVRRGHVRCCVGRTITGDGGIEEVDAGVNGGVIAEIGKDDVEAVAVAATEAAVEASGGDVGDGDDGEGGSGGSGGSGGNGGGDEEDEDEEKRSPGVVEKVGDGAKTAGSKTVAFLQQLFKIVPVQILTALIALFSGCIAQVKTNKRKKLDDKRAARKKMLEKRAQAELELRQLYENNHGPLLKSAAKLSERLFTLVEGYTNWDENEKPYAGTIYSAYLLAKYLAYVEHIKRSSQQTLNLGFPAADHIFLNILGRVQSTLGASDALLMYMQSCEGSFKPARGHSMHKGGPFAIVPRAQAAIGEIMLRKASKDEQVAHHKGAARVLSFSEFARKLECDQELRLWIGPVIKDFRKLRSAARAANLKSVRGGRWWKFWLKVDSKRTGPHRRTSREIAPKYVGSRPYAIQNALQDLIDFLDPTPNLKVRPDYRRRLQLGDEHPLEQLTMPASLFTVYKQLANIRDHVIPPLSSNSEPKSKPIDVFVSAANRCNIKLGRICHMAMEDRELGACPFSHRILITLRELGVVHNIIPVDMHHKPGWFHLLSGEGRVPVIYSDGKLISGSRQIMGYLVEKFPERDAKCHFGGSGSVRAGTMAFTRFFPKFRDALVGNGRARRELQEELRGLNLALETYFGTSQARMVEEAKGQPVDRGFLLGGKHFSRVDTSLAPLLHAVDIGGPAVCGKECGIPDDCVTLRRYLNDAKKHPSFIATCPSDEEIIDGWMRHASGRRILAQSVWLRDMLE